MWTESEKQMITGGDVYHYIGSQKVFRLGVWCVGDLSFPRGYNKFRRTYEISPAITARTANNLCVKVRDPIE